MVRFILATLLILFGFTTGVLSLLVLQMFYPRLTLSPKHHIAIFQHQAKDQAGGMLNSLGQGLSTMMDMGSFLASGGLKIETTETEEALIYTIKVEDLDRDSFELNIANGMVQVSGKMIKKMKESDNIWGAQGMYSSSFDQSFSLPYGVDPNTVKVEHGEGFVILKFAKPTQ